MITARASSQIPPM